MTLTVNGSEKSVPDGVSLDRLVLELALEGHAIAIEVNRAVVPKDRYPSTTLAPGDRVEIVTLVGGG